MIRAADLFCGAWRAEMRYLSVCSGIEAATVAWHPLGWRPVAFAEIEKFPAAVLAHHYPHVPNWGDLTKFREWPDAAIDLLVGGTPCQSFSVAGLRKGLADPRGNLALTFLAVVDRYRPKWVVWENVPGVLSADSHVAPDPVPPPPPVDLGRDGAEVDTDDEYDADESHAFACLVAGFSELGYFGAYGTLDAQYFDLAQRRARVFAVFHVGDWRGPVAVLFDRTSLSGHPAPRREAGTRTAGTLAARTTGGGGLGTDFDTDGGLVHCEQVSRALTACNTATGRLDPNEMEFVAHSFRADGFDASEDGTGSGTPIVPIQCNGTNVGVALPSLRRGDGGLTSGVPAVAFDLRGREGGAQFEGPHDTANLRAASGGSSRSYVAGMQVRRLTPRECERLQGFPDDYTLIPYRGKLAADGPRYKALGNSMAVPVMAWIGRRIQQLEDALREQERAS